MTGFLHRVGAFRTLLPILFFLLVGCGMVVRPGGELEKAVSDYVQRLRWMDFREVAGYLEKEDHRSAFLDRMAVLEEDLHVVSATLEKVDYQGREAETSIELEYYLLPSISVKKMRLNQKWRYLGGDRYHPGVWKITTPFPAFPPPSEPGVEAAG